MDQATAMKERLLDTLSIHDDELAEKFLMGEEISEELVKKTVRKAVCANELYPIMVGSALRNA
jgi:elongation factor G